MIFKLDEKMDDLKNLGVFQAGEVDLDKLVFSTWVRKACEQNRCGTYKANWACPPATGSIDEAKKLFASYDRGIVFTARYEFEKKTSYRKMLGSMDDFSDLVYRLKDYFEESLDDFEIFAAGSCRFCKSCAYPEPCRAPEMMVRALEGMGVDVNILIRQAGLAYSTDPYSIIYVGMVIFS